MISEVGDEDYDIKERERLRGILASIELNHQEQDKSDETNLLISALENYTAYKIQYKNNLRFDPKAVSFGNHIYTVTKTRQRVSNADRKIICKSQKFLQAGP